MTVTEQAVHDGEGRIEGGLPDDGWPPKPRRSTRTTSVSPWVQLGVVIGIALVAFVVWWFAGLRHDVRVLSEKVDALAEQAATNPPVMDVVTTTSLPPDRPPQDGETARRLIGDAVRVVFTPAMPGPARAVAVVDPGPSVQALAEASARAKCSGATVQVDDIRFIDDDHAVAVITFDVPGFEVASGYPFRIDVSRIGEQWKVAGSSVDTVLGMADGVCAG